MRGAAYADFTHKLGVAELNGGKMSEIPTPPPAPNFVPNQKSGNSAMPLASLICSILGLVGVLPIIGSILGLVFANMAKQQPLDSNESNYVKIAVILSWIGIGLTIVAIVGFFLFFAVAGLSIANL